MWYDKSIKQSTKEQKHMNIIQIFKLYPTEEACIKHLEKARWGNKAKCPYCLSTRTTKHKKETRHYCNNCKTSFSVTVRTIFHRTHLPLQKWFLAISLILSAKKGLSALQLSRDLEVNKNTACRIAIQIRKAMRQKESRELLTGIIEIDETYIGGKPRKGGGDKSKRGRGTNKTPVIGAVERKGRVSAKATKKDKLKARHLLVFIKQNIDIKTGRLITDEYTAYQNMGKVLPHDVIKHQSWYVNGDIHTNTIEGFWALLKRGMFGQFHSVSQKHLQKYIDEFCYRHDHRNNDNAFQETINRG